MSPYRRLLAKNKRRPEDERRAAPRVPMQGMVEVHAAGGALRFEGSIQDLSRVGSRVYRSLAIIRKRLSAPIMGT